MLLYDCHIIFDLSFCIYFFTKQNLYRFLLHRTATKFYAYDFSKTEIIKSNR